MGSVTQIVNLAVIRYIKNGIGEIISHVEKRKPPPPPSDTFKDKESTEEKSITLPLLSQTYMDAPPTAARQLRRRSDATTNRTEPRRTLRTASEPIIRPAAAVEGTTTVNKQARYNRMRASYN